MQVTTTLTDSLFEVNLHSSSLFNELLISLQSFEVMAVHLQVFVSSKTVLIHFPFTWGLYNETLFVIAQ